MKERRGKGRMEGARSGRSPLPGIVIADGAGGLGAAQQAPRILAFVWGGKVRPSPTLPYGRWKEVA